MPDPVFVMARLRCALYRPAVRRATVALIVLTTIAAVSGILQATDAARARWGDTRQVAVAERSLEPGEPLDASAVSVRDLPRSLVPDEALETAPAEAVARYPVTAGEPLVPDRLAPMGVSGPAALVPEGHRAVGLPTSQLGLPPVQPGDLVDILVIVPPGEALEASHDHGHAEGAEPFDGTSAYPGSEAAAAGEPAFPLVPDARVIDADENVVTVTVPAPDAPRVAYATANGIVTLALTGH